MNRCALALLVAAPLVAAAPARAETAAEILKMTDKAHTDFTDLTLDTTMIIKEPGKDTGREYSMVTITKGAEKRLVKFTGPGDVKGMGMLAEGRDTLYVYLPGFQRVRRLGTHVKNQGFMGSDLTYEDMGESTFGGVYEPKLLGEEGGAWVLELNLIHGKEAEFPKIKAWVDKSHHQMTRLEYYDAAGKNQRTSLRTDFKLDEGSTTHQSPGWLKMIDHRRNDHETDIHITKARANQNLPDDVFSQRSLARGL